jgi:phytoene dehydrogenase-like protein
MAFKRHANRSRDIEGLYFAGGSVHPGGGIPLVMLSGKMAAELINEAEKA